LPTLRRSQNGTSLVEIVAALAIMGIFSVVFLQYFGSGITSFRYFQDRTKAIYLAQSKIEELLQIEKDKLLLAAVKDAKQQLIYPREFTAFEPEPQYAWQASISNPLPDTTLRKLTVKIRWQSKQRERETELITLF
jgi:type II secretory pathway pseudopilin PulG